MTEHIISDERLEQINRTAYRAGKCRSEVYTQVGADGEQIVRCRDCYYATPYQNDETIYICRQWDNETVPSDGYCHMGERRGE